MRLRITEGGREGKEGRGGGGGGGSTVNPRCNALLGVTPPACHCVTVCHRVCLSPRRSLCLSPITLVVAKCWDPNPKGYFTVPRQEPVRPIDPSAWVAHTEAVRGGGNYPRRGPADINASLSTMTSASSSLSSTLPESERESLRRTAEHERVIVLVLVLIQL